MDVNEASADIIGGAHAKVKHDSAVRHVTGRAVFIDDIPSLPGVLEAVGAFERGDIVSIVRPHRERIACGIANYAARDIGKIQGLRSDRIEETLGYHYGQEVVHRNNLVLLFNDD